MKHRWLMVALVVAFALLLVAGCSLTTNPSTDQRLRGRMLLWHTLAGSETDALNQIINSFTGLNPNVSVKVQIFSTTVELNEQFVSTANTGFGPDMILAPSDWVQTLASSGLISPIDDELTKAISSRFNPALFSTLQISGQNFGIPLSLDTLGIYVNTQIVETPATTLSGLVEQANMGITVLMPINFVDAFWGIQAFGGQLFDADGQAILNQGGFANWLAWLRDARNAPGMIQDTNRDLLRQQFMAGEAGYYVGYASELNEIVAALGTENVTVTPQPNGPVGPAGPFVRSQSFFFSSNSSTNQHRLATELARFITNGEQSSRLMRQVRLVPANTSVRINARLFPVVAAFAGQARNGIPYPTNPEFDAMVRLGNEAYVRILEGGESPAAVAFQINNSINEANGFAVQTERTYACTGIGVIFLNHAWQQPDDLAALDQLIAGFREICPLIIVETVPFTEAELVQQLDSVSARGFRPTFGLVTQSQLAQLLSPDVRVQNLNNIFASDILQRFTPISLDAMRSQGGLYALPVALRTDALYYNRQLVASPAQTLGELRAQSMTGTPVTLDTRFEKAFWGVRAFGGQPFAATGASTFDQGGMAEWLLWLRESRDNYGVQLSDDGDELLRRFLAGESAYYVAGAEELGSLQAVLEDRLGIALLPSGPSGLAQPLVAAEGFVLRRDGSQSSQDLVLEFMRYVTDINGQTLLMNEADLIPANANVNSNLNSNSGDADAVYMSVLIEQAQTGFLIPTASLWQPVVELGTSAYVEVLAHGRDPFIVVAELASAINQANGIVVTPTPTPKPIISDVLREEEDEPQPANEADDVDNQDVSGESGGATPTPTAASREQP